MKRTILNTLFILFGLTVMAQEGMVIDMKITNSMGVNGTMKMYYSALGSRTKMKMNMPTGLPMGNMNMDILSIASEPNKSYMINDERKSYTVTESKTEKPSASKKTITVEKVGTETINGYKCSHAKVFSDKKEIAEMWVSKDVFADNDLYAKMMAASKQDQYSIYENQNAFKEADCEGFPVKTISGINTEAEATIELVKAEKMKIDKSLFELPKDYKQGNAMNTLMGIDLDIDKLMDMTPEQREQIQKMMLEKMGGQPK